MFRAIKDIAQEMLNFVSENDAGHHYPYREITFLWKVRRLKIKIFNL